MIINDVLLFQYARTCSLFIGTFINNLSYFSMRYKLMFEKIDNIHTSARFTSVTTTSIPDSTSTSGNDGRGRGNSFGKNIISEAQAVVVKVSRASADVVNKDVYTRILGTEMSANFMIILRVVQVIY